MLVTLGQQYNTLEKSTVMLYIYINRHAWTPDKSKTKTFLVHNKINMFIIIDSNSVCFVFSSHSFWTSSSLDVPAGVTQEEGHTGFLIHLLSAVLH